MNDARKTLHTLRGATARAILTGLAALALAASAPARADDLVTPVEPASPTTAPAPPIEEPTQPREVLVPVQPDPPTRTVKKRFHFGPDLELFLPTSSKTRERYGSSWFGIGAGFGSVTPEGLLGSWSGEFYLIHNDNKGHEAYIIPLGIGYRRAVVDRLDVRPYVGASVNLVLGSFNSPTDGIPWGLRAAGGGSVLAGVTFHRSGYIEARYLAVSKMRGLDFSGLNLTAGIRF